MPVGNRAALLDALTPLGSLGAGVAGGEGAIYLWARLPPGCEDDEAVVEWLVKRHGVCVIPGSSCGMPGESGAAADWGWGGVTACLLPAYPCLPCL